MMSEIEVPMIKIINAETSEEIIREMNAEELAQYKADKAKAEAIAQDEAAKAAEKAALLEKLGISELEAKLLLS